MTHIPLVIVFAGGMLYASILSVVISLGDIASSLRKLAGRE